MGSMEKINSKNRSLARKKYNNEVRSLAAYVKIKDPRIVAYRKKLLEEQKMKKEQVYMRKIQQARERAQKRRDWMAQEAKLLEEQQRERSAKGYFSLDVENAAKEAQLNESGYEENIFHCIPCKKQFSSQKTLENHQRSKKHKAAACKFKAKSGSEIKNQGGANIHSRALPNSETELFDLMDELSSLTEDKNVDISAQTSDKHVESNNFIDNDN